MIKETTYHQEELRHGVCRECGEESDEILKGDGRCVDCIAADILYEETMNMSDEDFKEYINHL